MTIDRRSFLAAGGALVGQSLFGSAHAVEMPPTKSFRLWKERPPEGGGPKGAPKVGRHGAISNIAVPRLDVYIPPKPNGTAVLIAAGGGYKRIELESEAIPAARWLNERGITACVLTYRLPAEGWHAGAMAPLQDAQRAMRLMHAGEVAHGLDKKRIGLLGFSAGGHLMGMTMTRRTLRAYRQVDDVDRVTDRPAFCAMAYPVITLEPPYDNTSTRKSLIGDNPTASQSAEWSVQTHVRGSCPPVFLVQAADDPISDPRNTAIMEKACRREHVSVERHLLASGGHGFGMGRPDTPTAAWPAMFEKWLATQKMI